MRKILPFLIFIIIGCSNQKKEEIHVESKSDFEKYDEYVWKAMLDFKVKEYPNALTNFKKAIVIIPDENVTYYFYAAASALNLNQDQTAKDLIIAAIKKTNASESYFDSFKEFDAFRDRKLFSEIKIDYKKYQADFIDELKNPEIYYEMEELIKRDQEVRTNGSSSEEMLRIDSLNIIRLIEINKKYGWQKQQWILLWHHRGTHHEDSYVWNYFRPYINGLIEKRELKKDFWAMFDEEKLISDEGVQMYGLYRNNFDQFPIRDVKKVDSLRATIGRPPLWYESEIYGFVLPDGYVKTAPNTMYN